ncbi:MAG: hypothetical protein EA402_01085 [Planctomycetota bacterium]|nr:MAG: hypothetical protein EA402_01085 [Planctomycetota bacterium]
MHLIFRCALLVSLALIPWAGAVAAYGQENEVGQAAEATETSAQNHTETNPAGAAAGHPSGLSFLAAQNHELRPDQEALRLLVFHNYGHDHRSPGPYRELLQDAVNRLQALVDPQGRITGGDMISGALVVAALAEAYAMTLDPRLRESSKQALDHLIGQAIQGPEEQGGWLAWPRTEDDQENIGLRETLFATMAVRLGDSAGLLEEDVLKRIRTRVRLWQGTATEGPALPATWLPEEPGSQQRHNALGLALLAYLNAAHDAHAQALADQVFQQSLTATAGELPSVDELWATMTGFFLTHDGRHWPAWHQRFSHKVLSRQSLDGGWPPAPDERWGDGLSQTLWILLTHSVIPPRFLRARP